MGIFGVIILTGVVVTFVVINLATASQFRRFVLTGDLIQAQNLSALLADYYARQGSWQGVESLLTTDTAVQSEMMERMISRGMMRGMTLAPARSAGMGPEHMQEMFEATRGSGPSLDRVVLVDANGLVIADSSNVLTGQRHPSQHLAAGVPVLTEGQQVGTVLVGSMVEPVLNPLDQDFLRSVNLAVLMAAVAVGVVALVLGSVFFFHITAPVRDLTGAAEAIAAGDLSQRVAARTGDEIGRLGLAFNTMADALDQAETLRRHMVADIAHELRTPLSLVQGSLEAILDGMYELNLENVDSVYEETLVLTRLVNDLRDLALAEAGQLRLEQEDVDMADLIIRSAERFRAQAAEQGVRLTTDLSTDLPAIRGDRQRIGQVLINLLSNALRYTPAGGQVVVAAKLESAELLASVTDAGQGIPPEDLPYVFERFYRADKSRARASGGSGLGLAIARQIVEAHGGRIWAESRVGYGSTFLFTLPSAG
jgi:signal transduction histidine kinase